MTRQWGVFQGRIHPSNLDLSVATYKLKFVTPIPSLLLWSTKKGFWKIARDF